MAGYWSSFFCFVLFMDNRTRENPAILTKQAWSIKGLFYGFQWEARWPHG